MTDFSWLKDHDQLRPRAELQAALERIGYAFSTNPSVSNQGGRPRSVGETADRRARVELIGPPEAAFKATLMRSRPGEDTDPDAQARTDLADFLAVVMPDWQEGPAWLAAEWERIRGEQSAETRFRELNVSLRASGDGSRIVLGVTWQPRPE